MPVIASGSATKRQAGIERWVLVVDSGNWLRQYCVPRLRCGSRATATALVRHACCHLSSMDANGQPSSYCIVACLQRAMQAVQGYAPQLMEWIQNTPPSAVIEHGKQNLDK